MIISFSKKDVDQGLSAREVSPLCSGHWNIMMECENISLEPPFYTKLPCLLRGRVVLKLSFNTKHIPMTINLTFHHMVYPSTLLDLHSTESLFESHIVLFMIFLTHSYLPTLQCKFHEGIHLQATFINYQIL